MLTGALIRRAYLGALLALVAVTAAGAFYNGVFFVAQPYQLNYGEGLAAWQAAHITDPAPAYAPIDHYPFLVFQYPPLFHFAVRAAARIAGTTDMLAAGRSVSLISGGLLCLIAGWITFLALPPRTNWRARTLAAIFAAALPATLYNFEWVWLARVDALAVFLSFAGIALFAARPGSASAQVLAAMIMVAALFTKQTALAAPIACLLLAWLMDRRMFLRMLFTMLIAGGFVLGWFAWRTQGQVLLHLFRYSQAEFSISRAAFGLLMNSRHVAGLLVLAFAASFGVLRRASALVRPRKLDLLRANLRTNRYRRTILLLAIYTLFAALSSLAFGKGGSDINYFLEWDASLAPLAGILLFRAIWRAQLRPDPAWLAALAVPLLLLEPGLNRARDGWMRFFHGPLPADREQMQVYRRMIATVSGAPGPVFSEDMNLLYKTGKDIPAEPAMIQYLTKAGLWDERPFLRMIQEKQFSLVVVMQALSPERYSPAVAAAIGQSYEPSAQIGDYAIYRPRADGAPQPP